MDPTPHVLVRSIALPTDLADGCEFIFSHGLAIALHARASLHLIHVHPEGSPAVYWDQLPAVRSLLQRWGRIAPGAGPEQIQQLGIHVVLDDVSDDDPVDGTRSRIGVLRPDLLILGTHRRRGLDKLIHGSVAERIHRASSLPTLFLGHGEPGFVDPSSGRIALRRVVVPTGQDLSPAEALGIAAAWLPQLGPGPFDITLVHAGARFPGPPPPPPPGLEASVRQVAHNLGDVVAAVIAEIELEKADLVVMATHGRDSWLDRIVGTKTESVVRWADTPVLVLPLR
ncbi:MAG: universal stress protein [Deltaproteobacteria bacterium]|nr:MAG: universal stress protein [Deltaproteobacteria bacterium]